MSFKRPPKRKNVAHDSIVEGAPQQKNVDIVRVQGVHVSSADVRIQQGMAYALAQMQKEDCTGNFRLVESQFANFLVPAIPNRTDLGQ